MMQHTTMHNTCHTIHLVHLSNTCFSFYFNHNNYAKFSSNIFAYVTCLLKHICHPSSQKMKFSGRILIEGPGTGSVWFLFLFSYMFLQNLSDYPSLDFRGSWNTFRLTNNHTFSKFSQTIFFCFGWDSTLHLWKTDLAIFIDVDFF